MKNKILLFTCILAFSITASAQYNLNAQNIKSLYQQNTDSLFQYLDKSPIITNVLYDRVAQFADLDTLSGLITNNTNPAITTSSFHFLQSWQELYDASYNQSNLIKPEWIDALITQKRDSNIVPIGVLNYRFNVLDSQAVQKNLIYKGTDSLLHDVVGRQQAPYFTREIFLASALFEKVRQGAVTFQFSSSMLLQNNPVSITTISIDFGEGQTATLSPGGSATIQIQQPGIKILIITANFSNGTHKIIRAVLEVEGINIGSFKSNGTLGPLGLNGPDVPPCVTESMQADIGFADYTTGENKKGEIRVGYYFSNCASPQLRKPIIILDGFDPGDDRNITQIYDLLYYNNGSANFGDEMRQQGYDVIIVNFPNIVEGYINPFPGLQIPIYRDGGADYVERNALAVVKLIQSVNQQLINNSSAEKLIVVGPSMGGLITRYALAYMEKNGQNHNTRLWVSFDSPHWGANIPIGDQYWLEYYKRVAGNSGAKKSLDNKIGSVAARQMLLHHWTAQSLTPAPNAFRIQFMQNLQLNGLTGSNGFPQNLRKVALTNGSGYGTVQQEGAACGKVLHLEAKLRTWVGLLPFVPYLLRRVVSESNIYFTSDYGNVCKVFDGWYQTFLWGNKRYEEKSAKSVSSTKSYDRVPGGMFNTQEVIKKEGEKSSGVGNLIHVQNFTSMVNNHAFIPTVSSLALTNQSMRDWAENLSTRNLVCTLETPFDDYFTPVNNENHVFLSTENVEWIKNQISTDFQNCIVICSPLSIAGDDNICNTTSNNYSIPNLPAGATVHWNVSPLGIATPNTPDLTQTTLTQNYNGVVTLTAVISNACGGQIPIIKPNIIISSAPVINFVSFTNAVGGFGYWCSSHTNNLFSVEPDLQNVSYEARLLKYPSMVVVSTNTMANTAADPFGPNSPGWYVFQLRATNACGPSEWLETEVEYVNCNTPWEPNGFSILVSPNPAEGDLNVVIDKESAAIKALSRSERVVYRLYDLNRASLINSWTFDNSRNQQKLNVRGIKPGQYILVVTKGKYQESVQVIIK